MVNGCLVKSTLPLHRVTCPIFPTISLALARGRTVLPRPFCTTNRTAIGGNIHSATSIIQVTTSVLRAAESALAHRGSAVIGTTSSELTLHAYISVQRLKFTCKDQTCRASAARLCLTRAIFELVISQSPLSMPEILWNAYPFQFDASNSPAWIKIC